MKLPGWMLPIAAVAVGSALMFVEGAPKSRWAVHVLSGLMAVLVFWITRRASVRLFATPRTATIAAVLLVAAVLPTLATGGIDGVHRWLDAGVMQIHASSLLAPALLVLAAADRGLVGVAALSALQIVHLMQPDAGQATALGCGALLLVWTKRRRATPAAWLLTLGILLIGAATWLRPDPLGSVAFVEDILPRAFARGVPWACIAVTALAAFVAAPWCTDKHTEEPTEVTAARAALCAFFAASVAIAALGTFPTPLLGYSPSPILGAFLGLATLAALTRAHQPQPHTPNTKPANEADHAAQRHRLDARTT